MKRGDLVTVAGSRDYGKPRPAVVIQSDLFSQTESIVVLLLSGTLKETPLFRLQTEPNTENGLRKTSQIMVDKIMTVRREKVGPVFGRLSDDDMLSVTRVMAVFLGIA